MNTCTAKNETAGVPTSLLHIVLNGGRKTVCSIGGSSSRERSGEAELIEDVSFHDLRHDFGHRAREVGWSLEEVAYYLGHITSKGTPAIQTTARYTQVSRDQVKRKLTLIQG